MYHTHTPAEGG